MFASDGARLRPAYGRHWPFRRHGLLGDVAGTVQRLRRARPAGLPAGPAGQPAAERQGPAGRGRCALPGRSAAAGPPAHPAGRPGRPEQRDRGRPRHAAAGREGEGVVLRQRGRRTPGAVQFRRNEGAVQNGPSHRQKPMLGAGAGRLEIGPAGGRLQMEPAGQRIAAAERDGPGGADPQFTHPHLPVFPQPGRPGRHHPAVAARQADADRRPCFAAYRPAAADFRSGFGGESGNAALPGHGRQSAPLPALQQRNLLLRHDVHRSVFLNSIHSIRNFF